MNRNSILSFIIVAAGTGALLATTATSQFGAPKAFVNLQPTTPGTSQSGHASISGTLTAGQLVGGGAGVTSMNATNISSGTLTLIGNINNWIIKGENSATGAGATSIYGTTTGATGATYGGYFENSSTSGTGVVGLSSATSGTTHGVRGQSSSPSGIGVYGTGFGSGTSYGVLGASTSPSGIGVFGEALAATGLTYGGYFQTASQSGRAVFGVATANTLASTGGRFEGGGIGVMGRGLSPTGLTYGAFGVAISPDGTGVFGSASSGTGFSRGGRFEVASPDGIGLIVTNLNTSTSNQPAGYFRNLAVSGNNWGVWGETQSPLGVGVTGLANALTGDANGVYGRASSSTGVGVFGQTTSLSGESTGVFGRSDSTEGAGVSGWGSAGSGLSRGVKAITNSTAGQALYAECTATGGVNYAGYFKNPGQLGYGVWIDSTGESGRGLQIRATGRLARGIWVQGTHPDGPNTTAVFSNTSTGGVVLEATSLATTGNTFSSVAFNNSPTGTAIWASNGANTGTTPAIYGRTSSTSGMGVEGQAPGQPTAFAVFAFGNLGSNGTKSFVIDHPLDPANKTLKHFCTEGEQPLNAYSGNIRTDRRGFATVELPDYFDEINRDVRYQLTVVDDSDDFVMVKVSQPVKNNQFVIRSSRPGIFVSWRVEGVRNDAWVRRVGADAVSDKPESLRGRYYDPESYGLGQEHGIGYRQPPSKK